MTFPTEFDFFVLKIGDGGSPSETFTISCGKADVNINVSADSSDHYVRDCAKPGAVPARKVRFSGKKLDVTASGLTNADTYADEIDLVGTKVNVKVEYCAENGTDGGVLLGTLACKMGITALNITGPRDGNSSCEITLVSDGAWTYTAA
ncbi:hypothetical protein GTZ99_12465 [Novosphingobium sp. FSY-8]|uniref:Phage tail tube protein n=1 Tax=Novosphingobium ovatum TaxID=1908523 RepID=A0ABW9XFN9_9SPHN|nr:phage tail tube protein [Novosphingobium ovatum]NBC37364.1 hypothetical protein [Novosphingobium ovatum]